MTVSFTLGKTFFKVAHDLLRFWIIILSLFVVPFIFDMLSNVLAGSVLQDFGGTLKGLIYLILIAVVIRYLKYAPKNTYSENSMSPKEEISYLQALPTSMFKVYFTSSLILSFYALLEWEAYPLFIYKTLWGHLILSVIAMYYARKSYNLVFDKIWPEDSEEVKLIVKHKLLLNGSSPDGLVHLEEGDRVKLIPSDVPGDEDVINVVNETPNGPIMMDKVFSKYFVQRLKNTSAGFMYGTISAFKSLDHIELTIPKDDKQPLRIFKEDDLESKAPVNGRYNGFISNDLDDLFSNAALLVVQTQQGSTSMIQRKFELGYNRAGRIVDQLEAKGILGPFEGSKAREVLIASEEELKERLDEIMEDISGRS